MFPDINALPYRLFIFLNFLNPKTANEKSKITSLQLPAYSFPFIISYRICSASNHWYCAGKYSKLSSSRGSGFCERPKD